MRTSLRSGCLKLSTCKNSARPLIGPRNSQVISSPRVSSPAGNSVKPKREKIGRYRSRISCHVIVERKVKPPAPAGQSNLVPISTPVAFGGMTSPARFSFVAGENSASSSLRSSKREAHRARFPPRLVAALDHRLAIAPRPQKDKALAESLGIQPGTNRQTWVRFPAALPSRFKQRRATRLSSIVALRLLFLVLQCSAPQLMQRFALESVYICFPAPSSIDIAPIFPPPFVALSGGVA